MQSPGPGRQPGCVLRYSATFAEALWAIPGRSTEVMGNQPAGRPGCDASTGWSYSGGAPLPAGLRVCNPSRLHVRLNLRGTSSRQTDRSNWLWPPKASRTEETFPKP